MMGQKFPRQTSTRPRGPVDSYQILMASLTELRGRGWQFRLEVTLHRHESLRQYLRPKTKENKRSSRSFNVGKSMFVQMMLVDDGLRGWFYNGTVNYMMGKIFVSGKELAISKCGGTSRVGCVWGKLFFLEMIIWECESSSIILPGA